jgi:hypothetical protein
MSVVSLHEAKDHSSRIFILIALQSDGSNHSLFLNRQNTVDLGKYSDLQLEHRFTEKVETDPYVCYVAEFNLSEKKLLDGLVTLTE